MTNPTTTTTTGEHSDRQDWLEFLASTRADSGPVAPVDTATYAAAVQGRERAVGWDPHEVWLDRIKKPRDEHHRTASLAATAESVADDDVKGSR